jgi:opine dehydrogenase
VSLLIQDARRWGHEGLVVRNQPFSVAVLGAGHGGLALAGHLARCGHRVALWNRSPEPVAAVADRGGVLLTAPGTSAALAPVALATSSLSAALAAARHVLVAVPASAHADIAWLCAPYLRDGQTVLLVPGRTGGALEFRRVLTESGCRARVLLGEANTFPFASRCVGPAQAVIYGTKAELLAAALPAARTPELLASWRPLLPTLSAARSVLQTGLGNLGAILHPVITLLNADRIRAGEAFDFYTDGVTPAVADVLAAADSERLRVARAHGVPACSLTAWVASAYGHRADSLQQTVGGNPAYVGIRAPNTLEHRYLLEDVPTGLVPLLELGRAAGLHLPVLGGLLAQARLALGGERWKRPRTLAALGLDGLGSVGIRALVERDLTPAPAPTVKPWAPSTSPGPVLVPQV